MLLIVSKLYETFRQSTCCSEISLQTVKGKIEMLDITMQGLLHRGI